MNPITLNPEKSRFELEKEGQIAVADFVLRPSEMVVTHVIVPQSLRGGGIASQLAAEVVAHARRENLQIVPQCSFMAAYMEKHRETHDLRA
ncbi:MAG TPA: GNAT family N-acetyltransferase [Abditibacterium sp.]|jgi:hypothetical protein